MWGVLGVAFALGLAMMLLSQAAKASEEPPVSSPFIRDLAEAEFEPAVLETSKRTLVVVDFWATWCGPCVILGPRLTSIITQLQGRALLAKVDIDQCPALAERYEVQAVPTVLFFQNGEEVERFEGLRAEPEIRAILDGLFALNA